MPLKQKNKKMSEPDVNDDKVLVYAVGIIVLFFMITFGLFLAGEKKIEAREAREAEKRERLARWAEDRRIIADKFRAKRKQEEKERNLTLNKNHVTVFCPSISRDDDFWDWHDIGGEFAPTRCPRGIYDTISDRGIAIALSKLEQSDTYQHYIIHKLNDKYEAVAPIRWKKFSRPTTQKNNYYYVEDWYLYRETLKIKASESGTNCSSSWEGQCELIDEDFHSFATRMSKKYEQEDLEAKQQREALWERQEQERLKKNKI
jgi:hypothetical protein